MKRLDYDEIQQQAMFDMMYREMVKRGWLDDLREEIIARLEEKKKEEDK